ncbi:Anaphase-promoting complex subunit 1 [Chytridiales sp. JEL 0842]|nr:Anaphase-promoting complex subunit 1 [Chytridiales sp. JEL 0842]
MIISQPVIFDTGRSYVVATPFVTKKAWPLKLGILIERDETLETAFTPGSKYLASAFYYQSHPLDDMDVITEFNIDPKHLKDPTMKLERKNKNLPEPKSNENVSTWDQLFHSSFAGPMNLLPGYLDFDIQEAKSKAEVDYSLVKAAKQIERSYPNDPHFLEYLPALLLALHLVYEDLKLQSGTLAEQRQIAGLLAVIAQKICWESFENHYIRDGHEKDARVVIHDVKFGPKNALEKMATEKFTKCDLDALPFGVATPLREALNFCKADPPEYLPELAYAIIGREDIAEQLTGKRVICSPILVDSKPSPTRKQKDKKYVNDISVIYDSSTMAPAPSAATKAVVEEEHWSKLLHLRFQNDDRVSLVKKILVTTLVVELEVKLAPHMSEDAIRNEQQTVLRTYSQRQFALAVGRGILTYATEYPKDFDNLEVTPIEVSAKLPPAGDIVQLDLTLIPPDALNWPNFHNGAALGLAMVKGSDVIDNTWLTQTRPDTCPSAHGGLMLGLGLMGYLTKFVKGNAVSYFRTPTDTAVVGFLLGTAASNIGTANKWVTKLQTVHIPALNVEINMDGVHSSNLPHAAALVGIGLNYLGTCRRKYVELALFEIAALHDKATTGVLPGNESHQKNREGHSLAAGLALGMMTLGTAGKSAILGDLDLTNLLLKYITGGRSTHSIGTKYGGMIGKKEINSGAIQVDVTAPGASIALALMYLKSNDATVAEKLCIPETQYLLDYVRSDLLLLRILCRSLIMWDSILPTKEWVEAHAPTYISDAVKRWENAMDGTYEEDDEDSSSIESLRHAYYHITAGACLSVGIKFAGSADEEAKELLWEYLHYFQGEASGTAASFSDRLNKSVAQSCFDVVLTSLAAVMAGTGDLKLSTKLQKLCDRNGSDITYGSHMACQMSLGLLFAGGGLYTLSSASNVGVIGLLASLYPRYPTSSTDNQCHLQALRHFWVLAAERRCLVTKDVETREVCPLPVVITYKPPFQKEVGGEPAGVKVVKMMTPCLLPDLRALVKLEVDTDRYWSMTLNMSNEKHRSGLEKTKVLMVKRKAGHLDYLKDPHGSLSIQKRTFPIQPHWLQLKKRQNNTKKQPSNKETNKRANDDLKEFFVKTFSSDPNILAYTSHFCNFLSTSHNSSPDSEKLIEVSEFSNAVLLECLSRDTPEAIPIYQEIYRNIKHLSDSISPQFVWNMKLIFTFYASVRKAMMKGEAGDWMCIKSPLLADVFIGTGLMKMKDFFKGWESDTEEGLYRSVSGGTRFILAPNIEKSSGEGRKAIMKAKADGSLAGLSKRERRLLGAYLVFTGKDYEEFVNDDRKEAKGKGNVGIRELVVERIRMKLQR